MSCLLWINTQSTQYDVTCRASLIVCTHNGGMNSQARAKKTIDRNIYRCQGVQADGAFAN